VVRRRPRCNRVRGGWLDSSRCTAPAGAIRDVLAAATEQADELITIVSTAGEVVHANGAFCRVERDIIGETQLRDQLIHRERLLKS
jgi:hypothetical protein